MNVLIVTIDATIVRKGPINFVLSVILLIFGIIKLSVLKMLVLLINGIIILFVKIVLLDAIRKKKKKKKFKNIEKKKFFIIFKR
jgi:hypothetical protein